MRVTFYMTSSSENNLFFHFQVNNQNPKIYISPLLLKQLHEQKLAQKEAELQRNLTNSADNKADFCKEATRVFGEALALKVCLM